MSEELSSGIGTKDYWEDVYKQELQNFHDYRDEGDIWFGKANVQRVVKWLISAETNKTDSILDVGCGNGMMLINLAKAGFSNLTGIDYIQEAIELAKCVAKDKGERIQYEAVDFLQEISTLSSPSCLHKKYKIIIDKGTYDAIAMCPTNSNAKRQKYNSQILSLLETNGLYILVSCNWTKDELVSHFAGLKFIDEIITPEISYGGRTGHTVTSIIMKKLGS